MKYYKNDQGQVYAYAADGSQDAYIKPGLVSITEEEADNLRKPPTPTPEQMLSAAIAKRDAMLAATDWYAIRASEPDGKPIPPEVLVYRAALRDIDQQPGWPSEVNWPTLPCERVKQARLDNSLRR